MARRNNYNPRKRVSLRVNMDHEFVAGGLSATNDVADDLQLVFFDLETSGLWANCDVLQIGAISGDASFNRYINPRQPIPVSASNIHGLSTNKYLEMFLNGNRVRSEPLRVVLEKLLQYLTNIGKPCVLIAHNCMSFDARHLIRIIEEVSLTNQFFGVIDSFVDTLPLFRRKFPGMSCNLKALAIANGYGNLQNMHDAIHDAILLRNITYRHFRVAELVASKICFIGMLEYLGKL